MQHDPTILGRNHLLLDDESLRRFELSMKLLAAADEGAVFANAICLQGNVRKLGLQGARVTVHFVDCFSDGSYRVHTENLLQPELRLWTDTWTLAISLGEKLTTSTRYLQGVTGYDLRLLTRESIRVLGDALIRGRDLAATDSTLHLGVRHKDSMLEIDRQPIVNCG